MLISRTTKSLILKTAAELILSNGYQGFSYNDISAIVKIKKASIHYYFPSKEDLGLAFIDKYRRMFILWGKRLGNISHKNRLIEFCNMYEGLSNGGKNICPIGMIAAAYQKIPAPIQERSKELILHVESWLEALITAGIESGEFLPDLNPKEISRHILNVMSGSLKMARIFRDMDRITTARETLIGQIFST